MAKPEITSLSSRGQVVIPQHIRNSLNLKAGEKFMIIGEDNIIILKKLDLPSSEDFHKIIRKTKEI